MTEITSEMWGKNGEIYNYMEIWRGYKVGRDQTVIIIIILGPMLRVKLEFWTENQKHQILGSV